MRHGSLFSGIGGFDLVAQWCGWENIFQVEIDDFCQRVLAKNFPTVKRYKDIKEFDGTEYKGTIDIISGGFPCQPFSVAGKRKGTEDDRSLWHEMYRVIKEIEPNWIVGENVTGIINMELDNMLSDLETEGYETQTFVIPACSVNAPHRRDRVWIIAYNEKEFDWKNITKSSQRQIQKSGISFEQAIICNTISQPGRQKSEKRLDMDGKLFQEQEWEKDSNWTQASNIDVTNANNERLAVGKSIGENNGAECKTIERSDWWSIEPGVGRVANGISNRVDRLKSLGNAIVPQVAYEIFKTIDKLNN